MPDMTRKRQSLAVVIASCGRPSLLPRLVSYLCGQTLLPDEIVLSVPDASHVGPLPALPFPLRILTGPKGSSTQRNTALEYVLGRFDIVTFFDDDFIPAHNYLDLAEQALSTHADWAVVMGDVVMDGATTAGIDWDDGLAALELALKEPVGVPEISDHVGAYGCNMSVRCGVVGDTRFDERLVLYGWQEDIDFTSQLRQYGRVVGLSSLKGVHLGMKTGKVSGRRFGYSQVVNPVYLMKKGTVPASFALPLMFRNIASNLVRSIRPESYIDRRGRLAGNIHGILHVMTRRERPEHVLRL